MSIASSRSTASEDLNLSLGFSLGLSTPAKHTALRLAGFLSLGTLSLNTSESSPLHERHKSVDRENMLAYGLYINNIDFTKHQEAYLTGDRGLPKEDRQKDVSSVITGMIPGFVITSQVGSKTLLFFRATEEATSKKMLIRLSPNYLESLALSRFINEWYFTLGRNPPHRHRLWGNPKLSNSFIEAKGIDLTKEGERKILATPLTLPKGIHGILYPFNTFNLDFEDSEVCQKRLGLVYHDEGFRTLHDYYQHRPKRFETSLASESLRSVISSLSVASDKPSRFLPRDNLGSGVFDDLANRVSQLPKSKAEIILIVDDMVAVAKTIATCHELGIVHNGLTCDNILKSASGDVKLTGWDFAFSIPMEDLEYNYRVTNIADISDLIAYILPESTGETTHRVDYRSDIYSFGIVLYEVVVGCLPFQSESPVRLRKMHLVQKPVSPKTLGKDWIPTKLNDIIMKCLEKDPELRYQEANSLISDLLSLKGEQASPEIQLKIGMQPFLVTPIKKKDINLPDDDGVQFTVISGEFGTGKTKTLRDIRGEAVAKFNFCISWTFNCSDMRVTTYAFALFGIRTIVSLILATTKDKIKEWGHLLTTEIDTDLSILFVLVPQLKQLLGNRYKSIRKDHDNATLLHDLLDGSDLGNTDFDEHAMNFELRFRYIVKKFFSLAAHHGLTILIDDVHWAPRGSLVFMREILEFIVSADNSIQVVAAYRTNEEPEYRPPTVGYEAFLTLIGARSIGQLSEHKLSPIKKEEFDPELWPYCRGNRLMLTYTRRILHLNGKLKDENPYSIVDEYVSILLTEKKRTLLKFAAIMTNHGTFKLSDLVIVTGWPIEEVHGLMQQCVETRIIIPVSMWYKVPFHVLASKDSPFDLDDATIWGLASRTKYMFDHDLVQTFLINEMGNALPEMHQLCGTRLRQKMIGDSSTIVTHYLTMATHLLQSLSVAKDKEVYFDVMVTAGRYSIATSSYEIALEFFKAAREFAPDEHQKVKNTLTLCQIQYSLRNYSECIDLILTMEKERDSFVTLKIRCLFHLKQYKRGLRIALKALEALGVESSLDSRRCEQIASKYFKKLPLSIADIKGLRNVPAANDPKFKLVAEIIMDVLGPTYILGLTNLRLALLTQLTLMMHINGLTPLCAIPLIHLANYFVQPHSQISMIKALEICEVALGLVNENRGSSTGLTELIYELYVVYMGLFKHSSTDLGKFSTVFGISNTSVVKVNEPFLRLFVLGSSFVLSLLAGASLARTRESFKRQIVEVNDEERFMEKCFRLWADEIPFSSFTFECEGRIDLEFLYLANCVLYEFARGNWANAAEIMVTKCFKVSRKLPLSVLHIELYFYGAIALLSTDKEGCIPLAHKLERLFYAWAQGTPANFKSKHAVILACLSSIKESSSLTTLDRFEEAIELGTKESKWVEVAFANKLCASWLVKQLESKRRAYNYAQGAYSLFKTIKASRQAEMVKKHFATLFDTHNWAGVTVPETPKALLPSQPLSDLKEILEAPPFDKSTMDLTKAIKLCLTISESSDVTSIVSSLLETALMFGGIDYGAIVLNSTSKEPVIKTIGTFNFLYKLDDEALSARTDLVPYMTVIHCLLTGETINKEDDPVHFENRFGKDPYYLHNPCSSALCIPIRSETVLGAMYLERHQHHELSLLFDSAKVDLLDLLCSQAAVSFSKAMLYSQMEHAKKTAEDATKEKASFLANMSHEIRTPFNSLFACSLFLLDTNLTLVQREYVETIKTSSLVTLNIIDGILAFSKIEHGSFALEHTPFSMNECIESAIQVSSDQAIANDVELAFFNRCPNIDEAIGDATRVRQIAINLIGNSVKFTLQGYIKVILTAEYVSEKRYRFVLTVEDTGIGIPEQSKSKVFGAFSQVDGSSRRVFGGSGLGLAISKKLSDIMNGELLFESEEGKGTTFRFACPFEITGLQKPSTIPSQKVAILMKPSLLADSLKEKLQLLNADVTMFHEVEKMDFSIVYVSHAFIDSLEDVEKNTKGKVFIVAPFDVAGELDEKKVDSVLFTPFKLPKIEETLRTLPQIKAAAPEVLSETFALRILVAEDNPINLKVASQHLKKLGYIADHAKDGVEVLEKCDELASKGEKYDVIFMDIQMPRKDGIAATIELKELFIARGLFSLLPSIIALTANVAGEDREKCLECGMLDFVSKPILPEDLKRVLTNVGRGTYQLPS